MFLARCRRRWLYSRARNSSNGLTETTNRINAGIITSNTLQGQITANLSAGITASNTLQSQITANLSAGITASNSFQSQIVSQAGSQASALSTASNTLAAAASAASATASAALYAATNAQGNITVTNLIYALLPAVTNNNPVINLAAGSLQLVYFNSYNINVSFINAAAGQNVTVLFRPVTGFSSTANVNLPSDVLLYSAAHVSVHAGSSAVVNVTSYGLGDTNLVVQATAGQ